MKSKKTQFSRTINSVTSLGLKTQSYHISYVAMVSKSPIVDFYIHWCFQADIPNMNTSEGKPMSIFPDDTSVGKRPLQSPLLFLKTRVS